jgi:Ulp1 family protease
MWSEIVKKKIVSLDFSKLDYTVIPINHNIAHRALVSASCKDKTINYYDSLKWNDGVILVALQDLFLVVSILRKRGYLIISALFQ